jgi:arylsulfatase A-like enzyme
MNGKTREIYPEVFGYFRQHQRMIRRNGWKYIWYPQIRRSQLFHLESDPHEMRDLSGESRHARTLQVLREALAGWQRQVGDPAVG